MEQQAAAAEAEAMKASWALQEAEAAQKLQADKLRASQAAVEAIQLNR